MVVSIHTVRVFGKEFDPANYKGRGWRSQVLYFFNAIRMWLERWCALTILRMEAEKAGFTGEELEEIVEGAKKNPYTRHWLYKEPSKPVFRSFLARGIDGDVEPKGERAERYGEGRKNDFRALAGTFANYQTNKGNRQTRYYRGRAHQLQVFGEDGIEAVPEEK